MIVSNTGKVTYEYERTLNEYLEAANFLGIDTKLIRVPEVVFCGLERELGSHIVYSRGTEGPVQILYAGPNSITSIIRNDA